MRMSEVAGVAAPNVMAGNKMSLGQVIGDLGASVAQAREVLTKSASTLEAVDKEVLPHNEVPATADGFLNVLGPGTSTMASFARALTVRGSKSTFKLILGHGISGDFATVVSNLPRRPNGKALPLKRVAEPATRLAETFMATMDHITAEAENRATRGMSESASER